MYLTNTIAEKEYQRADRSSVSDRQTAKSGWHGAYK